VGGHPIGLARAERELGLQSEVVVLEPNPFAFEVDRSLYRPGVPPWRTVPDRLRFLAEVARRYDVIHYNFGSALLPAWGLPVALDELPLLRRLGKILIATFQGDDARPADHQSAPRAYASFDPWSVTPIPPRTEGQLTILHAPSHRTSKGTAEVLAAVDEVRARGYDVRLDLVEGVPRDEALARCAAADIAIDQVKIGWYGGFAVEAMSLGKPVLCYIQDDTPGDNPFGDALGLVRTSAATLTDDLIVLIEDRERRLTAGAAGRTFVERHHDPRVVAREVLDGLVALPHQPEPLAAPR
jgi:hypothetical protein